MYWYWVLDMILTNFPNYNKFAHTLVLPSLRQSQILSHWLLTLPYPFCTILTHSKELTYCQYMVQYQDVPWSFIPSSFLSKYQFYTRYSFLSNQRMPFLWFPQLVILLIWIFLANGAAVLSNNSSVLIAFLIGNVIIVFFYLLTYTPLIYLDHSTTLALSMGMKGEDSWINWKFASKHFENNCSWANIIPQNIHDFGLQESSYLATLLINYLLLIPAMNNMIL